jgi:hypothetical protein
VFYFDKRDEVRLASLLNIGQTVFICFMLGFGALAFSKDATELVLKPVERMITKVILNIRCYGTRAQAGGAHADKGSTCYYLVVLQYYSEHNSPN